MSANFNWEWWIEQLSLQREGKKIISRDEDCPDCGKNDEQIHNEDCRRIFTNILDPINPREYLQYGPPWYEWEDEEK